MTHRSKINTQKQHSVLHTRFPMQEKLIESTETFRYMIYFEKFQLKKNLLAGVPARNRREKRQEDELWKGIDQSLFLGPCGSVVWANVLVGRVLFSCLNDPILLSKIQDFLQKKLSSIKLPGFMEDVSITQIFFGDTPPLIHRVSQAVIDERGTWIDADLTYEGLMHMTITTKLNLLRLKRQHTKVVVSDPTGSSPLNGIQSMGSSLPPTLVNVTMYGCLLLNNA